MESVSRKSWTLLIHPLCRKLISEGTCPAAVTQGMHFHPDSVLPFAQLQGARPARHTKVPVAAAGAPGQFALIANNETALAALLEDLPGWELEIQFEHGSCDRRSGALIRAHSAPPFQYPAAQCVSTATVMIERPTAKIPRVTTVAVW